MKQKCKTCYGYGMWSWGDTTQPMGLMDAHDGMPTTACPECGTNYNPITNKNPKLKKMIKKGFEL